MLEVILRTPSFIPITEMALDNSKVDLGKTLHNYFWQLPETPS